MGRMPNSLRLKLIDGDDLNQRALKESIRHFKSHPEFLLNYRRIYGNKSSGTVRKTNNSGQLELFPLLVMAVDRKLIGDDLKKVGDALVTLVRYHERKLS
jgi:hypothetical protein